MAAARTAPAGAQTARASEVAQPAPDRERRLLRAQERLPVAHAPARIPALENGVPLLQGLEARRHLGADEPGDAPTAEGEAAGPTSRAERGHRRRAVCEDHR